MKELIKGFSSPIIQSIVRANVGWKLCTPILKLADWLKFERSKVSHKLASETLAAHFKDRLVQNGFFKGLKYPGLESYGSSLFPKLSGSYENELHPLFNQLLPHNYNSIIDVGCAEGFYAVGLAQKFPNADVIAFDIDASARIMCKQMADENNLKLTIYEACSAAYFKTMDSTERQLILCDCEGFEDELFTASNINFLANTDLIVELHPMHVAGIKEKLGILFEKTHVITYISSYDDIRKIADLPLQYHHFPPLEKLKLVQEGRTYTMDWMICLARKFRA